MAIINKEKKYKWEFDNIGGSSRVRIASGEDIAHLHELDPKMWTVLSCPVTGLEIDEKSLKYMDTDGDGKIRVNDVIATSKWATGALKNADLLLEGVDSIDIEQLNQENEAGKKLYASAKQILENLGKDGSVISLADTADVAAIFAKTRYNGDGVITESSTDDADEKAVIAAAVAATGGTPDRSGAQGINAESVEAFYKALTDYVAWQEAAVEAPFGDKTDAAIDAYNALDAKVKDFFMRSKLAAFSPDSTASLDVQTARIEAISAENLTGKTDEIAAYPIVRVTGKAEIDLSAPVNPAWSAQFETIKSIAIEKTKSVLSSHKAMDIIANRASISPAVEDAIMAAVGEEYFVNIILTFNCEYIIIKLQIIFLEKGECFMKELKLKVIHQNWGLMGMGDWNNTEWNIYNDLSVEIKVKYNPIDIEGFNRKNLLKNIPLFSIGILKLIYKRDAVLMTNRF